MPTNDERLTEIERRLEELNDHLEARDRWTRRHTRELDRKINIGVSFLAGALQIYSANLLALDASPTNDRWAEWMLISGLACIGIGILALFRKEDEVFDWLLKLNPWQRD